MSGKTELRQAQLISEQKVVPGTGTLIGITVSAPITGGGSGPVVPIGATQYDATHKGYVPSPGVNNHSLILFDDGWFAPPSVSYPISVAHGGTGIDGTGVLLFAATGTAAKLSSPDGISLLAQTSNVAGDNFNPTLVARANTGQTIDVLSVQDENSFPFFEVNTSGNSGISNNYVAISEPGSSGDPQSGRSLLSVFAIAASDAIVATNTNTTGDTNFPADAVAAFAATGRAGLFANTLNTNPNATVQIIGVAAQIGLLTEWDASGGVKVASMSAAGLMDAKAYSCSAMPAAAGASGTIYADPITHALFITP